MDEGQGVGRWLAISLVGLLTLLALSAIYWPRPQAIESATAEVLPPTGTMAQVWLSTADRRLRLVRQPDVKVSTDGAANSPADITVDLSKKYQTMVGFGAALTDSSAWLIQNKMSESQRAALLQELFGPAPGLNFHMLRVTIGASDFSLHHYTLDDMPAGQTDPLLQHFNVAVDQRNVIPVLHDILAIDPDVRIIASPWSAPAWMKTSANLISGTLFEEDEAVYANYLVRYVDTFRNYGIPIFALTVENEPNFEPLTYPGMLLSPEARARIIGKYLGPALAKRQPRTQILGLDHNWDTPEQPLSVLSDPDAARYIDGIAWHCYRGNPHAQTVVHRAFPKKDTYLTECSGGDWPSSKNGELLLFARNILMESIKNWASGAVYWNIVLDEKYGPHAGGCATCKGIVTVDSSTGVISRNDEYYAFAHFSRFTLPGAVRVKSSPIANDIDNVAFQNADDGSVVLVVVNGNEQAHNLSVQQNAIRFQYNLPGHSVATFVWQPSHVTVPPPASSSSSPPPAAESRHVGSEVPAAASSTAAAAQ
ncbi:MAG: glycoside hydrolase family 30 beta sandwich domain-containing protein [Rhodanobacter sp.]